MNPLTKFLFELQEISLLLWRVVIGIFRGPRYYDEWVRQMDLIGVGSLPIILLTGFSCGGVLVLQTFPTLQYYGAQAESGRSVAVSLVRELGPVLAALMLSGRIGAAISAELGSMVVSQQIDAMRALGTDPIRKLVVPRVVALVVMLPLLTVAADIFGIIGGGFVATYVFEQDQYVFINSVRDGITANDIIGGILKPLVFGLIVGGISCHKGLSTSGGTAGVGLSTINAVVLSSIWVIIFDFFLARALQNYLGVGL